MIEGWVVRSHNPHAMYWIVKGYSHPEYGYVVIPYRLGNKRIDIQDIERIIPLSMYNYIECIGRYAIILPTSMIDLRMDPAKIFYMRENELPLNAVKLIEYLDAEWVGITGSWATFSESERSDIDILIYSSSHELLYEKLVELKNKGLISDCGLRRYNVSLPRLHGFQLLDACYKNLKYTIRILRSINKKPCSGIVVPMGIYEGSIVITSSEEPHLVPAVYTAIIRGFGKVLVETWHTRYQEIAPGSYKARLNLVYDLHSDRIIASPDIDGFIMRGYSG